MKNKFLPIILILTILIVFLSINSISAATLYWVGGANGVWQNTSAWSSSSGGVGGK